MLKTINILEKEQLFLVIYSSKWMEGNLWSIKLANEHTASYTGQIGKCSLSNIVYGLADQE